MGSQVSGRWPRGGTQLPWRAVIRPPRSVYSTSDLGPQSFKIGGASFHRQDVQLVNDRGHVLACCHFCPLGADGPNAAAPCVVYLHSETSCLTEAFELRPTILTGGASLFCFDFAGSGASGGEYTSAGYWEEQDLRAVLEHLRGRAGAPAPVALWGRSAGAVAAILRMAQEEGVVACVLDSPFSSLPRLMKELAGDPAAGDNLRHAAATKKAYEDAANEVQERAGFDLAAVVPLDKVGQITTPVLFAVAAEDSYVRPHHGHELHDAWGSADRRLLTLPGDHLSQRPAWFLQEAADFLLQRLAGAGPGGTGPGRPEAAAGLAADSGAADDASGGAVDAARGDGSPRRRGAAGPEEAGAAAPAEAIEPAHVVHADLQQGLPAVAAAVNPSLNPPPEAEAFASAAPLEGGARAAEGHDPTTAELREALSAEQRQGAELRQALEAARSELRRLRREGADGRQRLADAQRQLGVLQLHGGGAAAEESPAEMPRSTPGALAGASLLRVGCEARPPTPADMLQGFWVQNKLRKAALYILAGQLNEDRVRSLRRGFRALDADDDGLVTVVELRAALARAGVEVIPPDLSGFGAYMVGIDAQGNGVVNYADFLAAALEERERSHGGASWDPTLTFHQPGAEDVNQQAVLSLLKDDFDPHRAGQVGTQDFVEMASAEGGGIADHGVDIHLVVRMLNGALQRLDGFHM